MNALLNCGEVWCSHSRGRGRHATVKHTHTLQTGKKLVGHTRAPQSAATTTTCCSLLAHSSHLTNSTHEPTKKNAEYLLQRTRASRQTELTRMLDRVHALESMAVTSVMVVTWGIRWYELASLYCVNIFNNMRGKHLRSR